MNTRRRTMISAWLLACAAGLASWWWATQPRFEYLSGKTSDFVAQFAAPAAPDSPQTRAELDELLEIQRARTPRQEHDARADKKKDVVRFYAALGLDATHAPPLPALHAFTDDAEQEIGPYVRAAKERFRRLRPYEIEPRLSPCIDDVKGDLSYPSGHATYGYLMGDLLAELVPERRPAILERAAGYARQRMVCGVHFRSDIEAGERGASWLFEEMRRSPAFNRDADAARAELRAALGLPARAPSG